MQTKVRDSNIELLRIVAMFFIVAHHFVVNSGVVHLFDYENPTLRMFWMQIWGMWGKTAINAFVLITGYYMCMGKLTPRRFLKLFLEIVFYKFVMYGVFVVFGYEPLTFKRITLLFVWPFRGINAGFTTSFLWFYLFIPFYNIFIKAASRRELRTLISMLLLMFTVSATFFFNRIIFHHVFWYTTLYFIGAMIRLYPLRWMDSLRRCQCLLWGGVSLAVFSVCALDFLLSRYSLGMVISPGHMIGESNSLFALWVGVSIFLVFKNLKLGYLKWVNMIASTTFGVLLIHGANDGMRQWLWLDVVDVIGHYQALRFPCLVGFSIIVPAIIFIVCSLLDYLRICFVERPIFSRFFSRGG